jgi:hypothetical protein
MDAKLMAHRQRHDGVLYMNGIDHATLPVVKVSAAILPECALRARWRCRQCRRLLAGDTLIVRDEGRVMQLAQLATTAPPMLVMAALTCPRCGSGRIAMTGETT